jgi:hypothetical protein
MIGFKDGFMAISNSLPAQFEDLNNFTIWALPTETERNRKRRTSTMAELQAFYDAILPRMDAIIAYLNQFPLDNMPADAQRLFYMALSLMEVSTAVELLGEPDESGVFDAERFKIIEPHN